MHLRILCSALISALLVSVASAQTLIDDFSTSTNWSSNWSPKPTQDGSLSFTGSVLEFTSPADGTKNAFAARMLNTYQGSYTSDWSIQVDVHMENTQVWSSGTGNNAWRDLSLIAYNANGSVLDARFGATAEREESASTSNSFYAFAAVGSNDYDTNSGSYTSAANNVSNVALRLSYTASTQSLSAYYDPNGATGGYSWTNLGSFYVGSTIPGGSVGENWGMSSSNLFGFVLVGDSGINGTAETSSILVTSGQAYFDNLQGSGLTAVPEPSTYAALLGVSVLSFAALRRRKKIS